MKKVLFLLFTVIFILSCKSPSGSIYSYAPYSIKEVCSEEYFSQERLDSLMLTDTLPNLVRWMNLTLMDFDDRKPIIKKLHYDANKRITYVITIRNDSTFMTIRK